jgi:hypothetical protein
MNKVNRFENVEVLIPYQSTSSRFYFPDQPQLRFVSLLNMVSYSNNNYGPSLLSNNPVCTPTLDCQFKAYLVLYANEKESINRIPLVELATNNLYQGATGSFFRIAFTGQQVIWPKSYILFPSPLDWTALANEGITSQFVFPFGVYYN